MNTSLFNRIVKALESAKQAAIDADPGAEEDGGTCNLDQCVIRIPRVQEKTMQKIANQSGVMLDSFQWMGGEKWYFVRTPLHGQGNRRTKMAEAAKKSLEKELESESNISVNMFYQMD